MLIAAMNPVSLRIFPDPTRECRCTGAIIQRYLSKVSGPLLDRIDLHIEVPAVPYKELRGKDAARRPPRCARAWSAPAPSSSAAASTMPAFPSRLLRKLCALDEAGERTLEMAVRRMGLSARAHDRILKVARTIADLDSCGARLRQAPGRSGAVSQPGSQLLELSARRARLSGAVTSSV